MVLAGYAVNQRDRMREAADHASVTHPGTVPG
jgi:hypothetical protein